ncbi:hypothetical protein OZ664_18760 [Elizabethkingia sp. HX WHF]|uniref:Uncharacterized protein n=1 Tax=Elizabethkingia bruuniana TaxID=1756149 RepID=A0A7T7ZWD5_9FLAO|nr:MULTISPECIES: hypothetical protein [Elizabethkingia]ATL43608.1 hypothetical protein CQS02_10030 [Elizabethkingia miricola]AQX83813.1 hypothetical protein AYC65_01705 [Elizabethkingia bruuniana]KGO09074.1 hypothetical protein KS04_16810 [Elizabethkingia miricola]KUY22075.1 hypothetical protein ATB97_12490 [Elizabethkingia bruuniana]MCL1637907.1 hypothetical protein [Elizabethkingia bruuniana]
MKILKTSWINIVGIFTVLFLYTTIYGLIDSNISRNVFQAMVASLIGICFYGIMFWIAFILVLIILDLIIILPNQNNLILKLLLEWILISAPFIYWAITYERQRNIFILAIIAFLITQLFRERLIKKLKK